MSGIETLSRPSGETSATVPPPRRPWFSRVVLPVGIIILTLALLAYAARQSLWPATPVQVVHVAVLDTAARTDNTTQATDNDSANAPPAATTVTVQAPGWVEPDPYPIYVSALADGIIDKVLVLEGETVETGQVVAHMIDDDARLSVQRAEAELLRQRANLKAAQTDWDNPVTLERALAVSQAMLTEAIASRAQIDADIAQQRAKLRELQAAYDRVRSLSPSAASQLEVEQAKFRVEAQEALVESTIKQQPVVDAQVARFRAEAEAAQRDLTLRVQHRLMLDRAQAAVQDAETALAEAKLRLQRMQITSPASGIVMRRQAVPGAKVVLGMDSPHSSHVVHLYKPSQLQVRVDVPLADAAKVGARQSATVVVDVLPDQSFRGRVTRFVHEADISKNTVEVKVAIEDPSPLLKPDMLARVKFLATPGDRVTTSPTDRATATTSVYIPTNVIRHDGNTTTVWALRPDQTVERRAIEVGQQQRAGWVHVTSGLQPGDTVVADATVTLREGQRVQPIEE